MDIDECARHNPCSKNPLVRCINTVGSYHCGGCPPGERKREIKDQCSFFQDGMEMDTNAKKCECAMPIHVIHWLRAE